MEVEQKTQEQKSVTARKTKPIYLRLEEDQLGFVTKVMDSSGVNTSGAIRKIIQAAKESGIEVK